MSLSESIASVRLSPWREPPSWYVTNGDRVVGPLHTNVLLRGIAEGRVDRECYVAQHDWSNWREQNYIREIRALRRWQYSQRVCPDIEPVQRALGGRRVDTSPLTDARDREELFSRALTIAVRSTKANVGVLHQPRPPFVGLVTSWAFGPGMGLNLGEVIPWHDEARAKVNLDEAVLGQPDRDGWARASARRLCTSIAGRVAGVALVPIDFGGLRGLLELGRYDHPFRQSDVRVLEQLRDTLALSDRATLLPPAS